MRKPGTTEDIIREVEQKIDFQFPEEFYDCYRVANGFGITLLPEMALKKEAADKRIQLFPMKAPGPSRELALVWRSTSPYGPFFGAVADIIADAKGDEGKRNKRKAKR